MILRRDKLFARTMLLGALLTLGIAVAFQFGFLGALEMFAYDFRARHIQFFQPPPTTSIVHLDIDDASLEEIGAFPWPRTRFAEMIDEINRAGAKVISMDVLFVEPQDKRYIPLADGTFRAVSDDDNFAAAIRRAGNVLLPIAVDTDRESRLPLARSVESILQTDLEITEPQMLVKLGELGFKNPDLPATLHEAFPVGLEAAAFNRVSACLDEGTIDLPGISARLCPKASASAEHTDALIFVERVFPRAQSVRQILRRLPVIPAGWPSLLTVSRDDDVSLPVLTDACRYCASANFIADSDGVVRRIPLFVNERGHLLPQMALANTCAYLGVPLDKISFENDRVILPLPDGSAIRIPVTNVKSSQFGKAGLFMNIPWFGGKDWLGMYDYPRGIEPVQHVPLKTVWAICQNQHDIEKNNEAIDAALLYFAHASSMNKAVALTSKPPDKRTAAERSDALNDALAQIPDMADIPSMEKSKPGSLSEDEAQFLAAYHALKQASAKNIFLSAQADAAREALREQFDGRLVLIGWTATGVRDNWTTSLHSGCPGPVIQGVVFSDLVNRIFWRQTPWWVTFLFTLIIGSITTFAVSRNPPKRALAITGTLVIFYLFLNGIVFFAWMKLLVGVAAPVMAAAVTWTTLTLMRYLAEINQRAHIERRFRGYVDPQLVDACLKNPDLAQFDGLLKEMTVVFTDLAGFTTISEKLREATVPMLNDYMSLMLPLIRDNGGTWDKFLGDGIMFFFNAPADHPQHAPAAVKTVLQMQKAMEAFNRGLADRKLPRCAMRAGISSAPMVVGDAGSRGKHLASNYTVLGDAVNLGARLESANKAIGSSILINQRAAELCGNTFLLRPVGKLQVVGKTEGVITFEPLCVTADATDELKGLADFSRQVVDQFGAAQFYQCLESTAAMVDRFGPSKFARLYADLCKRFIDHPPTGAFNATISLTEK